MREDWQIVKLAEICALDKSRHSNGDMPYVGMEDIKSHTGEFLGDLAPKSVGSATFRFTSKHLLYGRLRPYLNKVMLPDFAGHCSSEIFPIECSERILRSYLFYWFTSQPVVNLINETCTGARMPRANVKEVLNFIFPLPPLPEQERIVSILDKAFEGIDKAIAQTEQNLASARELFESYLNNIFTQKGEDWVEKKLTEIGKVSTGKHDANHATEQGRYRFYTCAYKYLACDTNSFHGPALILAGNGANVGEVFYYEGEFDAYQRTYVVHDIEIEPKYLFYHLKAFWRERNLNKQYGSATNYLKIGNFSDYQVTYPCLQKQRETIKLIESISFRNQQLQALYTQKLNDLKELKQSLLQQAFAGELTKEDAA